MNCGLDNTVSMLNFLILVIVLTYYKVFLLLSIHTKIFRSKNA